MTAQEIFKNGKVLTMETAKTLAGKKIKTAYFGYRGQDGVDEFVVGKIVPSESLWANQDPDFIKRMIKSYGECFELLAEDGRATAIRCYPKSYEFSEPTFHCSDSDREVFFVEV